MAIDLYDAAGSVAGVFKGTKVKLNLGDGSGAEVALKGALVQSIDINYARQISRIWELGSEDTYYIVGRTEGQAGLSQIVGSQERDILDELADACAAKSKVLTLSGAANECDAGENDNAFQVTCYGPALTSRSFSVNAQQFIINSQASIMFTGVSKNQAAA